MSSLRTRCRLPRQDWHAGCAMPDRQAYGNEAPHDEVSSGSARLWAGDRPETARPGKQPAGSGIPRRASPGTSPGPTKTAHYHLPSRRREHPPARADYFDFARVTLAGAVKRPPLTHRRAPRDYLLQEKEFSVWNSVVCLFSRQPVVTTDRFQGAPPPVQNHVWHFIRSKKIVGIRIISRLHFKRGFAAADWLPNNETAGENGIKDKHGPLPRGRTFAGRRW